MKTFKHFSEDIEARRAEMAQDRQQQMQSAKTASQEEHCNEERYSRGKARAGTGER